MPAAVFNNFLKMMMPAAARIGDMQGCKQTNPNGSPHTPPLGMPITAPGVSTVLIEKKPAAVMGDLCPCASPLPNSIKKGSSTVFIGKRAAAREGDPTMHSGSIKKGASTVFIGD